MVFAVIDRELVLDAVEFEAPFRNAIPETSNCSAEAWMRFEVIVEIVEAQNDVGKLPVAIGNFQRHDDATEVDDLRFHAVAIRECVEINRLTVDGADLLLRVDNNNARTQQHEGGDSTDFHNLLQTNSIRLSFTSTHFTHQRNLASVPALGEDLVRHHTNQNHRAHHREIKRTRNVEQINKIAQHL